MTNEYSALFITFLRLITLESVHYLQESEFELLITKSNPNLSSLRLTTVKYFFNMII